MEPGKRFEDCGQDLALRWKRAKEYEKKLVMHEIESNDRLMSLLRFPEAYRSSPLEEGFLREVRIIYSESDPSRPPTRNPFPPLLDPFRRGSPTSESGYYLSPEGDFSMRLAQLRAMGRSMALEPWIRSFAGRTLLDQSRDKGVAARSISRLHEFLAWLDRNILSDRPEYAAACIDGFHVGVALSQGFLILPGAGTLRALPAERLESFAKRNRGSGSTGGTLRPPGFFSGPNGGDFGQSDQEELPVRRHPDGKSATQWKMEQMAPDPTKVGPLGEMALLEYGFARELGKAAIDTAAGTPGDAFAAIVGHTATGDPIDRRVAAAGMALPFVPGPIKKIIGKAGGKAIRAGRTGKLVRKVESEATDAGITGLRNVVTEPAPVDVNKLHHLFGRESHNLAQVVTEFGSREAAYASLKTATEAAVKAKGITGTFKMVVQVGGSQVTVRGNVVDGVLKIGTAYIP